MQEIMVSVIMPAYNCEKYIKEAVQSVLVQSVSFELIIINDHSTDHTAAAIQELLQDTRIQYIENEMNLGVAESRNKGIAIARGKYIAFLDADDYWTADKLAKQMKLMEEKNAVLSSTARELMDEQSILSGKILSIPEKITYKQLLKGNVLNTSGTMVLTSVARQYPMVADKYHEDYIMWLRILQEYETAYGIDEPLLKYRVMQGTKSANKLKSARMTFGVYRYMGFGFFKTLYYFCCYAIAGVLKYR